MYKEIRSLETSVEEIKPENTLFLNSKFRALFSFSKQFVFCPYFFGHYFFWFCFLIGRYFFRRHFIPSFKHTYFLEKVFHIFKHSGRYNNFSIYFFLDPTNNFNKINKNSFKPTVSEHVKDIVRRNFTKEIEFYEFCRQRLHKQYLAVNVPLK